MAEWQTMNNLSVGDLVTEADMDALRGNIEYLLDPNKQRALYTGGNFTTSSTSFVDVDATNISATLDTNGGPVLIVVSGSGSHSVAGGTFYLDVTVDGARQGGTKGLWFADVGAANGNVGVGFSLLVTGLSAAEHVFKLQWRVDAGSATLVANSNAPVQFSAIEL